MFLMENKYIFIVLICCENIVILLMPRVYTLKPFSYKKIIMARDKGTRSP